MSNKKFLRTFLLTLLLFSGIKIYAQQTKPEVPDGTEGETFKYTGADTVSKSKLDQWNEFDGPVTNLKITGGLLYDAATYSQDDASKDQIGSVESDIKLRDCRFAFSGVFKVKRQVTWKMGIMFDAKENSWFMRETGIMVKFPEIFGHIFVGRTKEGYSMSKVMNGYSIVSMERAINIDVIPILADGVKYMGYFPKAHIFTNLGYFNDFISKGQTFSTYKSQFIGRLAWLPVYKDATSPVLHVGINYRYGVITDGAIQVRSRPEVNPSPYFVDTKKFTADYSTHYGGELFFRKDRLLFGAEYNIHNFHSPENNNPKFSGGEVFVSYVFTGEVRPYFSDFGIFGFIKVKKSIFEGGPGAFEGILRYSNLDLTDGDITGGEVWRLTPGLIWHATDHIKIFTSYGFIVLKQYNMEGKTNVLQARVMYMI